MTPDFLIKHHQEVMAQELIGLPQEKLLPMSKRPATFAAYPSSHRKPDGKSLGREAILERMHILQSPYSAHRKPGPVSRRNILIVATAFTALGICAFRNSDPSAQSSSGSAEIGFVVTHTESAWRQILTQAEYAVLREEATEESFSSPLNAKTRIGTFLCGGGELPVYSYDANFDSKTGWPSFYEALPNAIGIKVGNSLFAPRLEVHCRRCGGHLGHIFDDGPKPTGERHCLNSVTPPVSGGIDL